MLKKKLDLDYKMFPEGNIPVFEPSLSQFKDFTNFVNSVLPIGLQYGVIKIIPPPEWDGTKLDIEKKLESINIKHPIEQNFFGQTGVFHQTNVLSNKSFTVSEFRDLSCSEKYKPPLPDSGPTHRKSIYPSRNIRKRDVLPAQPPVPTETPSLDFSSSNLDSTLTNLEDSSFFNSSATDLLNRESAFKSSGKSNTRNTIPQPVVDWKVDKSTYTPQYLQECERYYWRNLFSKRPFYGADLPGTLFDSSIQHWNLTNLHDLLHQIGKVLPGVNSPYLYFGMWQSSFAWHVEDMDLFSINYIHQGAPKQWYAIPPSKREYFERVMQSKFPYDRKQCPEFLRHKSYVASPKVLAADSIKVNKVVQYEGEFIITFPGGYHSGYNLGYNVAESINFATDYWIPIGAKAKACTCASDNVKIDMGIFMKHLINIDAPESIKPTTKHKPKVAVKASASRKLPASKKKAPNKSVAMLPENDFTLKKESKRLTKNSLRSHPIGRFEPTDSLNPPRKRTLRQMSVDSTAPSDLTAEFTHNATSKSGSSYSPHSMLPSDLGISLDFTPRCVLCRLVDGKLALSKDGDAFAHPLCAKFVRGIDFVQCPDGVGAYITGIKELDVTTFPNSCYRCKNKGGVSLRCSAPNCNHTFHTTCVHPDKLVEFEGAQHTYCCVHGPKTKPNHLESWAWVQGKTYTFIPAPLSALLNLKAYLNKDSSPLQPALESFDDIVVD